MLRMPKGGVAIQRANRDKPGIAGTNTVAAVVFAMIKERTDERGVEIANIQPAGFSAEESLMDTLAVREFDLDNH